MAKQSFANFPLDQSKEISPGLTAREADFFAQSSVSRGFYAQFGGDTELGRRKGNRGNSTLPTRRALTSNNLPFKPQG